MSSPDELIRERAYYLWIEAGRPEGQDDHFWLLATEQVHGGGWEKTAATKLSKSRSAKKRTRSAKEAAASYRALLENTGGKSFHQQNLMTLRTRTHGSKRLQSTSEAPTPDHQHSPTQDVHTRSSSGMQR